MEMPVKPDYELQKRISRQLIDIYIQVGLIILLLMMCFAIFKPFLSLMLWAVLLAVTMYPLHRIIAKRLGGKQGRAATLLILISTLLLVAPSIVLMDSFVDSVGGVINGARNNTLQIPAPPAKVAEWPVVGKKIYPVWTQAHDNLPAVVKKMQPKIGTVSKNVLSMIAGLAGSTLMFFFSWLVAGIFMAYGESGANAAKAIFSRIFGYEKGEQFTNLSTATIRAVAQGVIGVAVIQALVVGIVMLIAGIPFTGVLALIVLLLGIAQVPALLITLPVIAFIWISGEYSTVPAVIYSALLFLAGMLDNVLKPLMLGRGVDAPMPVILLGALGGMASNGIMGMFIGAVLLALGYQLFMHWVDDNPHAQKQPTAVEPVSEA
jgi:predicted PurR-regulated permease PerM